MAAAPPSIDPVNAITAVLAAFLSPAVAHVMGAYSVIFVASAFGSGWALMRKEKRGLFTAFAFTILMTGSATLVTVGVAQVINKFLQLETVNYLLAPLALLIGGIGHNWPDVVPWLGERIVDLILRTRSSQGSSRAARAADDEEETRRF